MPTFCLLQLLLRLEDDRLVETVGIPVKDKEGASRLTVCVSSQVCVLLIMLLAFWSCINSMTHYELISSPLDSDH